MFIPKTVQQVLDLHRSVLEQTYPIVQAQLEDFVTKLQAHYPERHPAVAEEIQNNHPGFLGKPEEVIWNAQLELSDFQLTIAKEYGFQDWEEVLEKGMESFDEDFEKAVNAIIYGRLDVLKALLERKPELIHAHSPYLHRARLIHYVGANGVEIWRQIVPENIVEVAQFLLDAGADIEARANIYGGSEVVGLVDTCGHIWEAGLGEALMEVLSPSSTAT